MTRTTENRQTLRLEVSTGSIVLVLLAIAAAIAAAGILVEARRIVSWAVACAVVAALIELVVNWLDRWMRRLIAIVLVLISLVAVAGTLVFGVFHDLDTEVRRLKSAAPVAAQQIEANEQLGGLAREIDLDRRVTEAVHQLNSPSSGLAGEAVSSVGTYAICAVLTVLFLSWGPKVAAATLRHLEPAAQTRVSAIAQSAFQRARRYTVFSIVQASVVGGIGWAICFALDLPAPTPLALGLAAFSLIPTLGVIIGAMPILLFAAATEPFKTVLIVAAAVLAIQSISTLIVQPRIVSRSGLHIGPAITIIAALVGFELYGIGGALYGTALTVLGVAVIDATADVPPTNASPANDAAATGDEPEGQAPPDDDGPNVAVTKS